MIKLLSSNEIIASINLSKLQKVRQDNITHDLKYLNYSFEVPYKMKWVTNYLFSELSTKKDILDLGCGPGWFPFIVKKFGHNVDCHDVSNSISTAIVFFEDILHALNLKKDYSFSILPMQKIPSEVKRYDIITALGMAFHHGWNLKNWYFFLDDIIDNHLKKNSVCTLFFQVNRNAAWELLESDNVYKTRSDIQKWEMFEKHILKVTIKT